MTTQDKIKEITEYFQNDCHKAVEAVLEKLPNCTVQDATNVWIFNKLAEIHLKINDVIEELNKL